MLIDVLFSVAQAPRLERAGRQIPARAAEDLSLFISGLLLVPLPKLIPDHKGGLSWAGPKAPRQGHRGKRTANRGIPWLRASLRHWSASGWRSRGLREAIGGRSRRVRPPCAGPGRSGRCATSTAWPFSVRRRCRPQPAARSSGRADRGRGGGGGGRVRRIRTPSSRTHPADGRMEVRPPGGRTDAARRGRVQASAAHRGEWAPRDGYGPPVAVPAQPQHGRQGAGAGDQGSGRAWSGRVRPGRTGSCLPASEGF